MSSAVLPGAAIGVFGSGQLGRMLAIAARRAGYRIHVFSPERNSPTGQIADVEITAAYDDLTAVEQFAREVDVVTFEFENVAADALESLEGIVPVRPGGNVLRTTQNRLLEKTFLQSAGIPVTPFVPITSDDDLHEAMATASFPSVLKTAASGYDGKGQVRVSAAEDLPSAWEAIARCAAILERFVDFQCELSVVAARSLVSGKVDFAAYPPIGNEHRDHILDVSVCPAQLPPDVSRQAIEVTRAVFDALDIVGVTCVEFFLTVNGELLVNELAPRPHNSGHLTIDAHLTCQFEQQLRSICGLPLGSTMQLRPAAMANLLGDVWESGTPNWRNLLAFPNVKLHLYGKEEPRAGRKMGHLTAIAESANEAVAIARQARESLLS
jgi:5-(carboxyamino)imidazole ribonucleotide synthase